MLHSQYGKGCKGQGNDRTRINTGWEEGKRFRKNFLDNFSKGSIILIMKAADFINPVKINLPTRAQLLLRWFAISSAGLIAWGDLFLRKGGTK